MRKLELENANLKERLDKVMGIYRDQLHEIVILKTKLELISEAMGYGEEVQDQPK